MINETPLVSIIIPIYNRESLVTPTMKSIISQTYLNWECILVDDGSTDNTINILNEFSKQDSRIKVFNRPHSMLKGANACRNLGLDNSSGKYVIFFDSDDIMLPFCIKNRVLQIEGSNYDMLVFSMGVFNDLNELINPESRIVCNKDLHNTIADFLTSKSLPWSTSRPIYKKSLISDKIRFNTKLQFFQDDEFNIKILKLAQPNYKSIDEIDMYYRLSSDSKNNDFYKIYFNDLLCFYSSIFSFLSQDEKMCFKIGLVKKIFKEIKQYYRPFVGLKVVNSIIQLFHEHLKLSCHNRVILKLAVYTNHFCYNRKGYDRIYMQLKKQIY